MSEIVEIRKGYFPANLGDLPDERGIHSLEESYPVTLTGDISGKVATKEIIVQNKDLLFDQFGSNNTKNRKLLYADVNRYGLDLQDWDVSNSLAGTLTERVPAIHPGIATNIENLIVSYETTPDIATVYFAQSGIELLLPANPANFYGTRQSLLASKRRFRVPPGSPVMFTMGVKAIGQGDSFIKQWGAFSSNTGYYMESIGDGQGDKLRIVRRYVEAGVVKNQVLPRSQWADPLDGTGASKAFVSLTNVTMWGFQISASDGGIADFYVYCEDAANMGIFRWIKFATIGSADSSFLRAVMEEGLPITFSNIGLVAPSTDQLLCKYGVSVTLSGDSQDGYSPRANGSFSISGELRRDIEKTAIALIEAKALIGDRPMSSIICPVQLSAYSQYPVELSLVLNPDTDPQQKSLITSNYYSDYFLSLYSCNAEISGGIAIGSFSVVGHALYDLRSVFSRVRSFLGAQFNNPFQIEGSSDFLAVLAQSRLYLVCQPLVPGYSSSATQAGLATNVEEMIIEYANGAPPVIIPTINTIVSLFFEDF
jgi:hypothetical protein